jgi:hypothetical protein
MQRASGIAGAGRLAKTSKLATWLSQEVGLRSDLAWRSEHAGAVRVQ